MSFHLLIRSSGPLRAQDGSPFRRPPSSFFSRECASVTPANPKLSMVPMHFSRIKGRRPPPCGVIARLLSQAFFFSLLWPALCVAAQSVDPQRALVLYSDERLLPANVIFDRSFRANLQAGTSKHVEFHSEFLDVSRFSREAQQENQRDFKSEIPGLSTRPDNCSKRLCRCLSNEVSSHLVHRSAGCLLDLAR